MRLLADKLRFEHIIDDAYKPEKSIVSRYRHAFTFGTPEEDVAYKKLLQETSLGEGARIFPLLTYRGVDIHILDESSLMHTGTLKSIDGCITISKCRYNRYERVVFESGGNTGTALTEYGQKAGLETFCFVPEENLTLLDSRVFAPDPAHLISVVEPRLVKKAAGLFEGRNGIKHIPQIDWRYEASMFRGFFILEYVMRHERFDWLTQTISAAFGPIGIYNVLRRFPKEAGPAPRFLGIQQEANCPMYKAWKSKNRELETPAPEPISDKRLLTQVMYDVAPYTYGTYQDLKEVLTVTRGDVTTVNHSEFYQILANDFDGRSILNLLKEHGVDMRQRNGEIIDKTGLIAVAGTCKEIEKHTIPKGSKVLCCLTSGTKEADGKAEPEYRVSSLDPVLEDCHGIIYRV